MCNFDLSLRRTSNYPFFSFCYFSLPKFLFFLCYLFLLLNHILVICLYETRKCGIQNIGALTKATKIFSLWNFASFSFIVNVKLFCQKIAFYGNHFKNLQISFLLFRLVGILYISCFITWFLPRKKKNQIIPTK